MKKNEIRGGVPRYLRQEDHEFKASLGYIARPCFKKKNEISPLSNYIQSGLMTLKCNTQMAERSLTLLWPRIFWT
jgi:hypothetical protein